MHTDGQVIHWAGFYDSIVRVIALGREGELRRLGALFARGRGHSKRHVEEVVDQARAAGSVDAVVGPMRPGFLFSLVTKQPG